MDSMRTYQQQRLVVVLTKECLRRRGEAMLASAPLSVPRETIRVLRLSMAAFREARWGDTQVAHRLLQQVALLSG